MIIKDLIKNIFTKIQNEGIAKIDTTYLKDNSWFFLTDNLLEVKTVYIFKKNGELLISENGNIKRAKWENLIHATNSLIIEDDNESILYNIIYLTSEYFVIQKDGTEQVKVFIKQERYVSKLPKELSSNPIEYIFNDLKSLLNSKNKTIKEIPELSEKEEIKEENETVILTEKYKREVKQEKTRDSNFEYFDILDIVANEIKQGNIRNKGEEAELIVTLQEKEEELIENGELCPNCKALNSFEGNTCRACNKKKK